MALLGAKDFLEGEVCFGVDEVHQEDKRDEQAVFIVAASFELERDVVSGKGAGIQASECRGSVGAILSMQSPQSSAIPFADGTIAKSIGTDKPSDINFQNENCWERRGINGHGWVKGL
jgi:hypothetical protein